MINELKVYNRFGELTLHLRQLIDRGSELLTIDGTENMRAAIAELRGSDFDRTIAKGRELVRLTSEWGNPEYLGVLARYFVMNFGWKTQTIETNSVSASPAGAHLALTSSPQSRSGTGNIVVITKVTEDHPDYQPTMDVQPIVTIPVQGPQVTLYGFTAA